MPSEKVHNAQSSIGPAATSYLDAYSAEENFADLQPITIHDTYLELIELYSKPPEQYSPWQVKMDDFVCHYKASAKHPLKLCLCAANGSGKDSYFIAPFAVWKSLTQIKATIVITSSSGPQLSTQTERYIRALCQAANTYWGEKIFKINQRFIQCLKTGSVIIMFATDEAGRAEGYHPLESGRELILIANECKSVKDDIFDALGRCTGFTHYIMVSSPGEPKGDFYWAYTHWPNCFRIRSVDCVNLTEEDRQQDALKYGVNSAYYRSKHEALFTSVGGTVVITDDVMNKCVECCTAWIGSNWPKRVGIDLAAGGDETVISIWQGNKQVFEYAFIEKDTTIQTDIIAQQLTSQSIAQNHEYINADDGGIGRGTIDQLRRRGWNISRVMNQTPAYNKREFGNKGAEMWFNMARMMQECLLLVPSDNTKLKEQLLGRHYKQTTGGNNRIFLQDKKDARAHGYPSPDRADAMALALKDLNVEAFLGAKDSAVTIKEPKHPAQVMELAEFTSEQDDGKFQYFEEVGLGNFANAELLRHASCSSDVVPFIEPKQQDWYKQIMQNDHNANSSVSTTNGAACVFGSLDTALDI